MNRETDKPIPHSLVTRQQLAQLMTSWKKDPTLKPTKTRNLVLGFDDPNDVSTIIVFDAGVKSTYGVKLYGLHFCEDRA